MIECKKPKVILYSHTKRPMEAVSLAVSAWASDDFIEHPGDILPGESEEYVGKALKAFHKTALEYVDTVWVIKNCSRAFQQQLTRTRQASFSIQSMRVVTKKKFATNGHYTMPAGLTFDQKIEYRNIMLTIEETYERMLEDGVPTEDARGILPLNIHSDISFRINLNALYHMMSQRLCVNTQWEFRQVAVQIKALIQQNLGYTFSDPISAPCVKAGKCPMREEYCGVPVWQLEEHEKMDVYEKFISYKKVGKEWEIKWVDVPIHLDDDDGVPF